MTKTDVMTILVLPPLSEHCIHLQYVALCQATTAGEAARYKAKALVMDNTFLEGLLSQYYVASRFCS